MYFACKINATNRSMLGLMSSIGGSSSNGKMLLANKSRPLSPTNHLILALIVVLGSAGSYIMCLEQVSSIIGSV